MGAIFSNPFTGELASPLKDKTPLMNDSDKATIEVRKILFLVGFIVGIIACCLFSIALIKNSKTWKKQTLGAIIFFSLILVLVGTVYLPDASGDQIGSIIMKTQPPTLPPTQPSAPGAFRRRA